MSEQTQPSLSISIVDYYADIDELRKVISSLLDAIVELRKSTALADTKIFLVDNSEAAAWTLDIFTCDLARLKQLHAKIEIIRGHGNVGYGAGHNLVINNIQSDYHLVLNPDVLLHTSCLAEGLKYLGTHTNTAIVSPYAIGYDKEKQYLCKTYPALMTFFVRGFLPHKLKLLFTNRMAKFEMHHLPETEPSTGVPIVSGCFMLCRTEMLKKIGGFDAKYFLYFEDFDLSLRIGRIGDIVYLPAMRIKHMGGHAARKGIRHLIMFANSGMRFFNTHGWRIFIQR